MDCNSMNIDVLEITVLKADDGKVLTNGEAYSSVGGAVYLGKNDNPENWHEITEAEYEEVLAEQERLMELIAPVIEPEPETE